MSSGALDRNCCIAPGVQVSMHASVFLKVDVTNVVELVSSQ